MRRRAHYPQRHCRHCGCIITPRYAEGATRFAGRIYCSYACHFAHAPPGRGARRSDQRDPLRRWGSAKLTELEVITMRQLRWVGRLTYPVLCRMFGRSHHCIWGACNGETWVHLPMPRPRASKQLTAAAPER